MTDQATPPVSHVQSIAAPNQNAPQPVLERKPHRFTAQNASFFGKRGKAAAMVTLQARALAAPEPLPEPSAKQPHPRLDLVLEQIALTRAALKGTLEPKDRAQLVRALCGLLDRERIIRGEPLPGSLKPMSQSRRRAAPSDLAPLPISPTDGQ